MAAITVIDTPCLLTDSHRLTNLIETRCKDSKESAPWSIDFTNTHIVALRATSNEFRESTKSVDHFVSDSQILTWAISLLGGKQHKRVYGPSFLDYFVQNSDDSLTHYFLGGDKRCIESLIHSLLEKRPTLRVLGSHHGYFQDNESRSICDDICAKSPDCLWIGLGTPKQQRWIHRNKEQLKVNTILAVGFAFDVNAGTKKDAPRWMGPLGVTWLYRLVCEPRRLFKRYFKYNSIFLVKLTKQFGLRALRLKPKN